MKKSEIKFIVTLDKENIPEKIEWMAEDSINNGLSDTKSISLSLWDEKKNNTLRIDLWTKEMKTDEMKRLEMNRQIAKSSIQTDASFEELISSKHNITIKLPKNYFLAYDDDTITWF